MERVCALQKRDVKDGQDGCRGGEESVSEQTSAHAPAPAATHSNASWSQTDELNRQGRPGSHRGQLDSARAPREKGWPLTSHLSPQGTGSQVAMSEDFPQ